MRDLMALHRYVCSKGTEVISWPPDVFGFVAYFCKLTGIYTSYARNPDWVKGIGNEAKVDGLAWIEAVNTSKPIPPQIHDAWQVVCRSSEVKIELLKKNRKFVRAMLYLLACADEACAGVGIADSNEISVFELVAGLQLSNRGDLCKNLPADSIRVLPKMHTPQSGLNIRSLSHHLALCSASEVEAGWANLPLVKGRQERSSFNILLAPWPLEVDSSFFLTAEVKSQNDSVFGYVDYKPNTKARSMSVVNWLRSKIRKAKLLGQVVDLVVFPECALSDAQWNGVSKLCEGLGVALISGVHSRQKNSDRSLNLVKYYFPLLFEEHIQYKHHRWLIDEDQIKTYSFGGSLDAKILWWENIEIRERRVQFLSVDGRLSICALVCEDLARQDPVAELVRAVGPNLVIALLMDGPQLISRWSSRYASVLADDPGSSVLTLSSLGMVERSRPNGVPRNRTIASWKDAHGDFLPIELAVGDEAVLLNVQFRMGEEWTIDGRRDGSVASFPFICGTHSL